MMFHNNKFIDELGALFEFRSGREDYLPLELHIYEVDVEDIKVAEGQVLVHRETLLFTPYKVIKSSEELRAFISCQANKCIEQEITEYA